MSGKKSPNSEQLKKFSGFYKLTSLERLKKLQDYIPELTDSDIELFAKTGPLELETVNRMVENAVGIMPVPFGVAVNFLINDKIYSVPMAIEEPSVIAAACNSAKLTLSTGGFIASATEQIMIGQIQILNLDNPEKAIEILHENKEKIIDVANTCDKMLVDLGGGARDVQSSWDTEKADNPDNAWYHRNVFGLVNLATPVTDACIDATEEVTSDINTVYPNPATNEINVNFVGAYSIFSIAGQLIENGVTQDGVIDVSYLNSGVYVIKAENMVAKFVK